MDKENVKRRIHALDGLPSLPAPIRTVLAASCRQSDLKQNLGVLYHQQLFLRVILAKASSGGLDPLEGTHEEISQALSFFGHRQARNWALLALVPPLFPEPGVTGLPREAFWKHCLVAAFACERIAEFRAHEARNDAFPTGFLHDIGKLALETLAPPAYGRAVEAAREPDVLIRHAEREVLGLDHTLAGKWLGERWGLPRILVEGIWLHHQPGSPAVNASTNPVLMETVALGNALARKLLPGSSGDGKNLPLLREQVERLGLTRADLELVRAETIAAVEQALRTFGAAQDLYSQVRRRWEGAPGEAGASQDNAALLHDLHRLRRESDHYRLLHEFNVAITPDQPPETILETFVALLRKRLQIPAGACLVLDRNGQEVWGARWTGAGQPEPFRLPAPEALNESTALNAVDGQHLIETLGWMPLAEMGLGNDAAGRHARPWPVPMICDDRCTGYVVVFADPETMGEAERQELVAFASAAATALHRAEAVAMQRHQTEELARALGQTEEENGAKARSKHLESIRRIASGIAHEVNNPLAVISGHAQLLQRHAASTPEAIRSLRTIEEYTQRASCVLSELLKVAQPEIPTKEPAMPHFLLHEVVGSVRDRLEGRQIEVEEEYEANLPRIYVDAHQIGQVILHLIENAEDAMEHGGHLSIRAATVAARSAVVITVADTGAGMDDETCEHAFDPFFSGRHRGDRSGLGLAVCLRTVEAHGGAINIESRLGEGTTVQVTLPAGPSGIAALTAEDHEAAHSRRLPLRWERGPEK
jgi:signal transduction histidine kinase